MPDGVQTGPFGSQLHQKDYVEKGIPIITVEHLGENRIVHRDLPCVSDADRKRLAKYSLQTGDIVFSRVGSVDRRAIVQKAEDGWLFSGRCLRVRPDPEKLDSKWLSYFFGMPAFKQYIRGIAVGATMPSINTKILSDVPIYFPELDQQRAAGRFLNLIDDKIELNRHINQTLEAMAQAIFKSWFVDFDPVKAKIAAIEQGQDPLRAAMRAISGKTDAEFDQLSRQHYDQLAATAALFPDAMEGSELGEIPKGWRPGTISELCQLNPNSWSNKSLPATVEYVDLANTKNGEIVAVQTISAPQIPSRARRILQAGDTIVGTVRPGNRSFALVGEPGLTGSTGFAVLRPIAPAWTEFVYLAATADSNIERLTHLADGGAYPAVRPEVVAEEETILPDIAIAAEFHRLLQPNFKKILSNRKKHQALVELRDTLLPKLLSGELAVAPSNEAAVA